MTCWRRVRDWQAAGVWHRLHRALLDRLGAAGRIDWSRASADSARIPANKGVRRPARTRRIAANRHDRSVFAALVEAVAPIKRPRGRPRRRPAKRHADKADDIPRCRASLRHQRIGDRIARMGRADRAKPGRHRWVVERTLAWLARYRRLAIRYERCEDIHQAFLDLACAHSCLNSYAAKRFC